MKEIDYLNYPTEGTFCRFSPGPYKPLYKATSYETEATYSRRNKPSSRYFTNRENDEYHYSLLFQRQLLNDVLIDLLREKDTINFLDVGCGEGKGLSFPKDISSRINKFGITAAEFRTPIDRLRHAISGKKITRGNAEKLTVFYPRNFFDVVVSMEALCHMDQTLVLPQIVEVMMPGGIAMLLTGSDILASRIPRVTDLESYESGVSFRKSPEL